MRRFVGLLAALFLAAILLQPALMIFLSMVPIDPLGATIRLLIVLGLGLLAWWGFRGAFVVDVSIEDSPERRR